ncbi:ABC transporter ATP-binding protein [Aquimarina agarivorans]|uniref:ABC transporter ATP-binding protein n=1 Tax=Aquimarina agarivorans TaxID=980584 RepID=UPI000248E8B7|nr:ABC transporter ATP-binding protein [Aquimarina agarivorans]
MEYIKKIFRFIVPYKGYAILNIIFNILYALFGTLGMLSILPMLDVLFKIKEPLRVKPKWTTIGEAKDFMLNSFNFYLTKEADTDQMNALYLIVGVIVSLFLLKNLFRYLAMYSVTFLRNGVLKDMRNELYDKTLYLPVQYFSEKRKGDTIARISSDVNEIQNSLLSVLELVVREPMTILFAIIAMLSISVKLTFFVFIFIPVSGFIISKIGKRLKKHSAKVQKEQGVFLSVLDETLHGLRIIKGYTAEVFFGNRFKASTERYYNYTNTLSNRQNLASPISEFLGITVIAVLLIYGGRMVLIEQTLGASDFIAYIALAYQILTPAKAISKASYGVKRGNAAADRVLEILELESPLKDADKAQDKTTFDSAIHINNISFKYEDHFVLKDFSLSIPKGKSVALVGQSGSGKSTVANLLTRFYDVNKGSISIDEVNIKDFTKKSLRDLTGLVTQDSILFNDTIKANLCIAKEDATDNEVVEALKVANAWEFVEKLPNGIYTNVGDGGGKLSGGQKQRLSIARAVLKNAPIMILDEATSALDTESERLVQDALEKLMKNSTSVVIAHRLSTIQNSDLIVVMKEGKIVEQGTHNELIAKNGNYKLLVDMQALA